MSGQYYVRPMIHETLANFAKAKTRVEKIKILQKDQTPALADLLRCSLDERVQFLLPEGPPPYTPAPPESPASNLLKQNVKLTYWVKGGKGSNIAPFKREKIFLDVIETIHPEDAKVLLLAKDKKPLCKGLTAKLVKEAFPGLLP